jgi:hypothetical protein
MCLQIYNIVFMWFMGCKSNPQKVAMGRTFNVGLILDEIHYFQKFHKIALTNTQPSNFQITGPGLEGNSHKHQLC